MAQSLKEKIIELRKDGKTYSEIETELNCSKATIHYHCKLLKLNGGKNDRISDELILKIKELSNKKIVDVAKELGISISTVKRYKNKKETIKITNSQSVIDWRKRTKLKLVEYKGGVCIVCGYNKSIEALQFHHLDPKQKDFAISGKSWAFDRLKEEVDKCILVCANCHIEIHNQKITELP